LDGCWGDIEQRIVPLLPQLLRSRKWTVTERKILRSWLDNNS
jgi:hypothetical protein